MPRKRLHVKIIEFISNMYGSLKFFYRRIREYNKFGNYYFPYQSTNKGRSVYILANGPSLKEELNDLFGNNSNISDSLVVNFFVESEVFLKIKPKYYCLADPIFNVKQMATQRGINTFMTLDKEVTWDMTLFVWRSAVKMISEFISNPKIKVVGLSILSFEGFEKNRYKYYKDGIAVPSYVNVTIMALYALLNLGYSTIFLYGVDHSFLSGIGVNDNNRLCIVDRHFYGTEKYEFEPKEDGSPWTMKDFVYDKYLTFVEHEVMRGYADYLGAQIINCTKDSWIDAYVRKAQLEEN